MEIVCESCQARLSLPEDKVPIGGTASFTCPKCGTKQVVRREPEAMAPPGSTELEFLEEGVRPALVAEADPGQAAQIRTALEGLGFRVSQPKDAAEALRRLKFNRYELVVVSEGFPGAAEVRDFLNQLPMAIRRNLFLVLLGNNFKSFSRMEAFQESANLLINTADLSKLAKMVSNSMAEGELFNKVFKETLGELLG